VPHFTNKANLRDYIKEKHSKLKAIFIEPGYYMQNWTGLFKAPKLDDGTVVFAAPMSQKAKLHLVDIEDTGPIIREILNDPEKFVGQDVCICGESIALEDVPKVFTKVTGIPAISKTLSEEEFRSALKQMQMSKFVQDELVDMYKWFEQYGYYGKDKDWTNGQKLTKLNTVEQWLKKTGWKGE
jgi:hypothetical protein